MLSDNHMLTTSNQNSTQLVASSVSVNPRQLSVVLAVLALVIVLSGSAAHIVRHQVIADLDDPRADVLRRLDIVEEPSLSQWFSSSLHLTVSFLTLGIGLSIGREMKLRWMGLAALFCYASIDEAIMLHEMMDRPTKELLGTSGFLSIAWIIPGSCFALVIAIAYLSFLRRLRFGTAVMFVVSGVVFLTGAILMEIPGGYLYERYGFDSWHYIASYAVEEALEMLGVILFIGALLAHIGDECTRSKLTIRVSDVGATPCAGASE